ncbi:MAG: thiamine phosphate synthase [Roseburia sp.]
MKKEVVAVTNRRLCEGDFLEQIKKLAEAGFSRIILREKDLPAEQYRELAEQIVRILEPYDTICTLHNFLEVAVELQVESIHLPLPVALEKKEFLQNFSEIGCSTHSIEQLNQVQQLQEMLQNRKVKLQDSMQNQKALQEEQAATAKSAKNGNDLTKKVPNFYVTAGHVFPTDCKKNLPPKGLHFLQEICEHAKIPVYALGGISAENIEETLRMDVAGACLMSYCMKASGKELQELVKKSELCG